MEAHPTKIVAFQARRQDAARRLDADPPVGAKDPVRAVEPLGCDPEAARIVFHDGRTYEVRFTPGKPAAWNMVTGSE